MPREVLMLGSARDVRGGVSAMVNVLFADGLFERWPARYVATHCDGTPWRKARLAAVAWVRVMAAMLRGSVALLHMHIATGASFWRKAAFALPARALGVPYILHLHGGDFDADYARRGAAVRALVRHVYRHARAVVVLSEEWRRVVSAMVPGARIVAIPNPVPVPAWSARVDADPPTVLYLGVLAERKGVHDLLAAFGRVVAAVPGARLVLAGSGDEEPVRRLVHALGLDACVQMPGWIGPGEKERLLARASLLVLPSHWEALPMAVLEAMAAGVPVVATRVGAIPEAVTPDCGVLVAPRDVDALADAMRALLEDGRARLRMGEAARVRAAATFSTRALVPRLEALWQEA